MLHSRELIQFWMIYVNKYCSDYMMLHKIGIFRSIKSHIACESKYYIYDGNESQENNYTHMTSPIRRIVDLLNQIMIKPIISNNAKNFLGKWMNKIDYINSASKAIMKIQNECALLHTCFNDPFAIYEGTIIKKTGHFSSFKYVVYLDKLKLLSKSVCNDDFEIGTRHSFQIFLFEKDENCRRKIRLKFNLFPPDAKRNK